MSMMMSKVSALLTTVTDFYKDINPATLSGAIDIVCVRRADGSYASSPFHVRFGKLQLLRPHEKVVEIRVNDVVIPDLHMKVGEAGEAFFVVEAKGPIPEGLSTSPISQPITGASDIEPLDLDQEKEAAAFGFIATNEDTTSGKPATNMTLQDEFSKIASDDKLALVSMERTVNLSSGLPSSLLSESLRQESAKLKPNTFTFEDSHLQNDLKLATSTLIAPLGSKSNLGDKEILHPFSDTEADHQQSSPIPISNRTPHSDTEFEYRERSIPSNSSSPRNMHSIMSHQHTSPDQVVRAPELAGSSGDLLRWQWGWGKMPERGAANVNTSPLLDRSPSPNEFEGMSDLDGDGDGDPIQLSLIGYKSNLTYSEFRSKQVRWEQFYRNPKAILESPSLVARFHDQYLPWAAAVPFIVSSLVFGKQLPHSVLNEMITSAPGVTRGVPNLAATDVGKGPTRSSWRSWWSRSTTSPAIPVTSVSSQNSGALTKETSSYPAIPLTSSVSSNGTPLEIRSQLDSKLPHDKQILLSTSPSNSHSVHKHYFKTLRLTSDQLKALNLNPGANQVSFTVRTSSQGGAQCHARIFLWESDTQIVISDIDGTITKSDALGHFFTMLGRDWTHSGVASLYTGIQKNGYQMLYLTSRAIGQAQYTRNYLNKVEQGTFQLPDGPVFLSPDRLVAAFTREIIQRRPEEFKVACLRDVQALFEPDTFSPFYAGFGNRATDAFSYRAVGVPVPRIFTINPTGEVRRELLEGFRATYVALGDLVDQIFPPCCQSRIQSEFNDWRFWRRSFPNVELPPDAQDDDTEESEDDVEDEMEEGDEGKETSDLVEESGITNRTMTDIKTAPITMTRKPINGIDQTRKPGDSPKSLSADLSNKIALLGTEETKGYDAGDEEESEDVHDRLSTVVEFAAHPYL
jgi:phosphatidate phosphatase LPIN